jgi:hypothetical protein
VNGNGDWVTVIQLTDDDAIRDAGLGPLGGISVDDDGGSSSWDPKVSERVRREAVQAGGGVK